MNTPHAPGEAETPLSRTRAELLFHSALERGPAEREAFLVEACRGDTVLIREARALIAAHERAGDFLEPALSSEMEAEMARLKPEVAGERIGPYKLLQQIGQGGFGAVWMAEQEQPVRRRVALKIIKLGMDTKEVIARFEQERQALAMMDHPNIAKVFDAGATPQGRPYFVMELVRGVKMTDYCDQHALETDERLRLFMQVCRAVQHAHQKGIIHRDLKPSNVLVTINDGVAVPKVIDFGLVKATQARLTDLTLFTQFERFIGTPAYMSPEQAEMTSLDIDTRSDIYSLGVLLYELLTGHTPLDAKTLMERGYDEMRRAIRECDPPIPSMRLSSLGGEELTLTAQRRHTEPARLSRAVRGDLDWIVMKCLEKSRSRRYETASGIAMDIERHLANEPIIARPPATFYRLKKLVLRNKVAVGAGSLVLLALILGLTVALWQFFEKSEALRAQSRLRTEAESGRRREERLRVQAEQSDKAARQLGYAASMSAVWTAWENYDIPLVRAMLARAEPSERGFEWFYLQRMMHLNPDWQVTLLSRKLAPENIGGKFGVFSPDGSRLVTVGEQSATLWDVATWTVVGTLEGGGAMTGRAAFSRDGKFLATAHADGTTKIWDPTTARQVMTLRGHAAEATGVVFSTDGLQLLTSSADGTIRTWERATGNEIDRVSQIGPVDDLAISIDGRHFATCSADATAQLWDVATKRALRRFEGHSAALHSVAFSPDGKRLLTASADETARLWDVATGTLLLTLRGHSGPVFTAAFSPDQTRIVTSGADGYLRVWHPDNGLEMLDAGSGRVPIPWAAFAPNNQSVVAAYAGTIELWERASQAQVEAWEKDDARAAQEVEANERSSALVTRVEYLWRHGKPIEAGAISTQLLQLLRMQSASLGAMRPQQRARLASVFLSLAQQFLARGDTGSATTHSDHAEQFLAPFANQPVPVEESSFDSWVDAANVFIEARQWQPAEMILSRLRSVQPENVLVAIALAPVLVETGDAAKYAAFRSQLLADFSRTDDVMALRAVPKLVCLEPLAGAELDAATRMMTACAAHVQPTRDAPWMQLSQGILAMRRGDYAGAVEVLRPALAVSDNPARQRAAHAVVALALWGLAQPDQARSALVEAKKIVRHARSPGAARDWVIAEIFLREAEGMVGR
jgi:serine/threonine protein kinase